MRAVRAVNSLHASADPGARPDPRRGTMIAAAVVGLSWSVLQLLVVPAESALSAPPQQDAAYDVDAFLVRLEQAPQLAALLTQHKNIRLESGDYTASCARSHSCTNLTLQSGMSIHGLPGSRVPTVVVQPGSSGIMLTTLELAGLLHFPASDRDPALTSFCSFFRIVGAHVLFEGQVSNLQFIGMTNLGAPELPRDQSMQYTVGGIHVAKGASVTDSRFVRVMVHGPWPTLSVALDNRSGSVFQRNTVLWENSLGAMQATFFVQGATEFTVVGSDIESYGAGNDEAAVLAQNVGDLRLWGMHGRVMAAAAPATDFGIFDIDAKGFLNLNPVLGRVLGPNETSTQAKSELTLREGTTTWIQLSGNNYTTTDHGTSGELRVLDTNVGGLTIGGQPADGKTKLSGAQLASFSSLVLPDEREGSAWGRPNIHSSSHSWRVAAQQALHAWQVSRQTLAVPPDDDSSKIQAIIDATPNSTQTVPPGVYWIAKPLRLPKQSFLVGAGPDKTFIFALDPHMSMVVGAGGGGSYQWNLAGLTLAGAAYGVHFEESTMGLHAQVTGSFFSHVQFANFSSAAIFMENICKHAQSLLHSTYGSRYGSTSGGLLQVMRLILR